MTCGFRGRDRHQCPLESVGAPMAERRFHFKLGALARLAEIELFFREPNLDFTIIVRHMLIDDEGKDVGCLDICQRHFDA